MKKKIVALFLVVALLAIAVVGGTLAYFTDTDAAENVFVVGNIDIDLHEANQEGDVDNDYQDWLAEQLIMPGIQLDKIVTVENVGKNDAYVRVIITVPENMTPIWNEGTEWMLLTSEVNEDGATVYTWVRPSILAPTDTTSALLKAVKLNESVTEVNAQSEYNVTVKVEAIQADSFADWSAAFAAYNDGTNIATKENADNIDTLTAGLATDNTVVNMTEDVTSRENLVMGSDSAVLDGNGNTLYKEANESSTNAGVETAGGTVKNITIKGEDDAVSGKGFRAIYATSALTADLNIDNANLNGTYAINVNGDSAYGLYVKNSTLNGWVSYGNKSGSASFNNCDFVTTGDLAMLRAYADTTITDCTFAAGYALESANDGITIILNNVYVKNGDVKTLVTAANFTDLFAWAGNATVVVDGVTVVLQPA